MMDNETPILIGTLNKPFGLNGFIVAQIGHPVFEVLDRYIIFLESMTPDKITGHGIKTHYQDFKVRVPFYRKTLEPCIDPIPIPDTSIDELGWFNDRPD